MLLPRFALLLACALALASCTSQKTGFEPVKEFRMPSSTPPSAEEAKALQEMMGVKKVEQTSAYQRFEFRKDGEFLISNEGVTTQTLAANFCQKVAGFELSNFLLPMVLTMGGLPFSDLHQNNVVGTNVLHGNRSGLLFWVKETKEPDQTELANGHDILLELLDGCGPSCSKYESLRTVNTRLSMRKVRSRRPQVICVSAELKKNFDKN